VIEVRNTLIAVTEWWSQHKFLRGFYGPFNW